MALAESAHKWFEMDFLLSSPEGIYLMQPEAGVSQLLRFDLHQSICLPLKILWSQWLSLCSHQ
jgi:hypothetical protein